MRSLYEKDKKNRKLFLKNELNYFIKKSFVGNMFFLENFDINFFNKIFFFKKVFFLSHIRNRCLKTFRGRGIYSKYFKVSGKSLKIMVNSGYIYGLKKSSW